MAELADALDSGSSEGNFMQVQVLLSAPYGVFITNFNRYEHSFYFEDGFGYKEPAIKCGYPSTMLAKIY